MITTMKHKNPDGTDVYVWLGRDVRAFFQGRI